MRVTILATHFVLQPNECLRIPSVLRWMIIGACKSPFAPLKTVMVHLRCLTALSLIQKWMVFQLGLRVRIATLHTILALKTALLLILLLLRRLCTFPKTIPKTFAGDGKVCNSTVSMERKSTQVLRWMSHKAKLWLALIIHDTSHVFWLAVGSLILTLNLVECVCAAPRIRLGYTWLISRGSLLFQITSCMVRTHLRVKTLNERDSVWVVNQGELLERARLQLR